MARRGAKAPLFMGQYGLPPRDCPEGAKEKLGCTLLPRAACSPGFQTIDACRYWAGSFGHFLVGVCNRCNAGHKSE